MNNHQLELAAQLAQEGYLHYCTCGELPALLARLGGVDDDGSDGADRLVHKAYEPGDPRRFAAFLDRALGFTD